MGMELSLSWDEITEIYFPYSSIKKCSHGISIDPFDCMLYAAQIMHSMSIINQNRILRRQRSGSASVRSR